MTALKENEELEIFAEDKKEKYLIRRLVELPPEKLEYVIRGLKERLSEKHQKRIKEIINNEDSRVLSINELINLLAEYKDHLLNHFFVKKIGIFGSYAVGKQTSYSDIDFVVHFFEGKKIGFKIIALKDFLEDVLGKSVDVVSYDSLKENIKINIEKEVIYLWEEISQN